jgi:hypothetical protein
MLRRCVDFGAMMGAGSAARTSLACPAVGSGAGGRIIVPACRSPDIVEASLAAWPQSRYREAASMTGRATGLLLLTEARWVHRRVETVDLLSTELARRRASVDFTVPSPLRTMLRIDDTQAVAPVATLTKQPLRNFDLRDEAGRAIPVLGRDQNGDVAYYALLGVAEYALAEADADAVSPRTAADLRAIATGDPDDAATTATAMVRAASEGDPELSVLLEDDWMRFLLSLLGDNYILMAVLEDLDTRRILKLAYDEALEESRSVPQRIGQGLGATPLTFQLDAPAAGRATSYHAEVVIPGELRIEAAVLYDLDDLTVYGSPDVDADRGALYATDVDPSAAPAIFVRLRAQRAGLPTMAFTVSLVTAALLGLGAVVFEPDAATGGPPVAVLLAGSAFFAGAVAQRGEHNLARRFFTPMRAVLVVVAVAALLAAASLAYGASTHTIDVVWKVSASVTTVLTSILGFAYVRAVPISRSDT